MLLYGQPQPSARTPDEKTAPELQQKRKARLMTFLTEGLPTLPSYVFELNTLLSSPSVDLKRLRTLVLTCSVMEFTGRQLPRGEVQTFWQHSFMSGLLSERIAKWIEYTEREQAYLGGLLHDIGMLPLLVIAAEENALKGDTTSGPWGGSLEAEKEYFGLNHCEVGRWIGQSWNF